jgi:hypothetical protein
MASAVALLTPIEQCIQRSARYNVRRTHDDQDDDKWLRTCRKGGAICVELTRHRTRAHTPDTLTWVCGGVRYDEQVTTFPKYSCRQAHSS